MAQCSLMNERCLCTKYGTGCKCSPSEIDWFDEPMQVCEIDEACRKGSIFGNYYFTITEEQLEALKDGKVLYVVDEYGMFIALEKR